MEFLRNPDSEWHSELLQQFVYPRITENSNGALGEMTPVRRATRRLGPRFGKRYSRIPRLTALNQEKQPKVDARPTENPNTFQYD